MAVAESTKAWGGFILASLILTKPFLVVLFQGFVYTTDLTGVYLSNACIGTTTQTLFAFCLMEVLIACVLLKNYVVPAMFRSKWQSFDHLKQRKMVGFVVKIIVRMACLVQICVLVAPRFSLMNGMFSDFNVKDAATKMVRDKTLTTCKDAGMELSDAAALRAWTFTRDDMMAVMIWELAFIPELPWDAWLHHIFVILAVTLGTDPQLLGSSSKSQPFIDGFAFFLVLGATSAALVEMCVLMYHIRAADATKQAFWMGASISVQLFLILVLFLTMPIILIVTHWTDLGVMSYLLILLVAFLTFVELKMVAVKRSIVKKARRKATNQVSDVATRSSLDAQQSFTHNLDIVDAEISKSLDNDLSLHSRINPIP